jgi:sigma-B regulation protein RsbU (phosphoserine phosphatase)
MLTSNPLAAHEALMKILLADDDDLTRTTVGMALNDWGFEVACCSDGTAAWEKLRQEDGPRLALLDWLMPGLDGPEICRRARSESNLQSVYLILLTARSSQEDIVEGLSAGADDYVAKPFDREELRLRLRAGERILNLQSSLGERVTELEEALTRVSQLQKILPICSYCKKVRNDRDYWEQVEAYISAHVDVRFSHGICPECYESRVKPELAKLKRRKSQE